MVNNLINQLVWFLPYTLLPLIIILFSTGHESTTGFSFTFRNSILVRINEAYDYPGSFCFY